ncbi:MAG: ATP-binding cassette domain-containing protein [Oscillospiraceae bacterium]
MAIEVKNITKTYGGCCALDGVSLRFGENKIYGLLGNNGAGKTTLLNIITNRIYATGGEVVVDGELAPGNDRMLHKMFMVGEKNLYPDDMRVKKAFSVTKLFYPDFDEQYALEVSKRFGLNTKKKITALSTGYASIFRLITGLSSNTPYLLLDEPVLGLDAQHRDMFYKLLIEKYSSAPCTVIISTHLIQEVAELIEHTVIIRDGRIIKDMPSEELLSGAYTVSGPARLVDEYLAGRETISETALGGLKTACVQGVPDSAALPVGIELGRINLQDYFISLMNGEDAK